MSVVRILLVVVIGMAAVAAAAQKLEEGRAVVTAYYLFSVIDENEPQDCSRKVAPPPGEYILLVEDECGMVLSVDSHAHATVYRDRSADPKFAAAAEQLFVESLEDLKHRETRQLPPRGYADCQSFLKARL